MILAIQTAGPTTVIYMLDNAGCIIATKSWESARQLADELLGVLQAFLTDNSADFNALSGIIVYSGPGSFTSLRIGHTVINALGSQLKIPVIGTRGDNWLSEGVISLPRVAVGVIAMPFYGAEPNITRPKG